MTLYHYTSGEGIYGIINSGELHCTNVDFLNDSSEQSYFQEVLNLVFAESKEAEIIFSTLFNASFQKAVLDPFDRFIASFSKNADSLSMWNYYAKGNGYNIGLDIDTIIEENANSNISIRKIELTYNRQNQVEAARQFLMGHKTNCEKYHEYQARRGATEDFEEAMELDLEQNYLIEDFNDGIYKLKLGFKHQAYEREEEVRLIISENEVEQKTARFRMSPNGVFIEYLPLRLNLGANLKSITIHPLNGELHTEGTKRFVSSKCYKSQIDIRKSTIPFRIV